MRRPCDSHMIAVLLTIGDASSSCWKQGAAEKVFGKDG